VLLIFLLWQLIGLVSFTGKYEGVTKMFVALPCHFTFCA
ncbi:unnamed protein product, partial [Acidithrix sp. C25]